MESAENDKNATLSLKGNITKESTPLEGKELSEMVRLMSDGTVYVNVHTDEFQDGAIRGRIASGLPEMESNATSSVVSNTTSGQG